MTCSFGPGALTVIVEGIDKAEGKMALGLYRKAEGFPDITKAHKGVFIPVEGVRLEHTFPDIADGEYALAVFHDANDNGEMDTNFFKVPKEGYAFSNNVKGRFGPPSFDDAAFTMDGPRTVSIRMMDS
jgi:uncharacterized protein (DUF2141 family)